MTVAGCGPQGDPTKLRGGEVLLQLVATGEVEVRPDQATVTVGVYSTGPTAEAALQANSATMTRVLAAVEAAGVTAKDARTSTLSLHPGWYNRSTKQFQSRNEAQLTIRDVAKVGAVVAAANGAGRTMWAGRASGSPIPPSPGGRRAWPRLPKPSSRPTPMRVRSASGWCASFAYPKRANHRPLTRCPGRWTRR